MDTCKQSLRKVLREKRRSLWGMSGAGSASRLLQERLLASQLWEHCVRVAAYVSVNDEVGTERILKEAWRSGREVFLPRCRRKVDADWQGGMDFILCPAGGGLVSSTFGIPEPLLCPDSRILSGEELAMPDTLIIVPALAFDRTGFRLGYGGGYYDRLLSRSSCPSVGLAFHELLLDELPREAWDKPVQAVCTEEILLWP